MWAYYKGYTVPRKDLSTSTESECAVDPLLAKQVVCKFTLERIGEFFFLHIPTESDDPLCKKYVQRG